MANRIHHLLPLARWPTRDEAARARLYTPIDVGPVRLLHRTWVPAMVPWRATESGDVTDEVVAWYGRFAEGEPGALVVEATGIRDVPSGPLLRISDDRFLPGLERIAREIDRRSRGRTRSLIQIIDFLPIRRRPAKEKYLGRFLEITARHSQALVEITSDPRLARASDGEIREALLHLAETDLERALDARELEDLRFGHRERVTDLHVPSVRDLPRVLPDLFAAAARRAERAGFDGVELHYAHAYTMASFLSRRNDRDDGYGGSREDRVRLPLEVYRAARAAIGPGTALGCRMLSDEIIEGGSRVDDAAYYAVELARAGIDFVSLSVGGKFEDARQPKIGEAAYPYTGPSGKECMPTVFSDERGPFGRHLPLARVVRQAVREAGYTTPVIAAGAIQTFEAAEGALLREDADIIAAARQSLADPDWFLKVRLGRGEEVRRCEATSYCEGLDQKHQQVTCRLWDRCLAEPGGELRSSDGKRRLLAPPWLGRPAGSD